ncbi:MAG: LysR family transcriptional regulator [Paracoccus sp. BP8]|uniref:LysR family transcriptional regulator n=1 Tax=Paracoccus sp. J55 TaxID=935849 RepID=UPI0004B724B6|nr:LysR family transcriptional regulator [Paracoccus sp. J55]RQP05739.1 MAG: LysR family transcriptional regulator [Paracoccus sp. BP8]
MSVNLASIEMRLLVVMDALLAENSVSKAAARLGMSQPATSNALNRLRQLFNDPLFVRVGSAMQPTARSQELAAPLSEALRQIENILVPQDFQPQDMPWVFTLAVSENASAVLLPALLAHLAETAPNIRVLAESHSNAQLVEMLDRNAIDFAIGVIPHLPRRFSRAPLFHDRYVCMMRRGHPLAQGPLTLDEFLQAEHLAVKPGFGETSRVDQLLAERGIQRNIFATAHQFVAAPAIVAHTNLLALMLERMLPMFDTSALHITEAPVEGLSVRSDLVWSQPRSSLPSHKWMARKIQAVARTLPQDPRQTPDAALPALANSLRHDKGDRPWTP